MFGIYGARTRYEAIVSHTRGLARETKANMPALFWA